MKAMKHEGGNGQQARIQNAALCYRITDEGKTEVLLITSRDTGRWVLPKGWPMAGKSPQAAAAREAFEEAGVEGEVSRHCLGFYSYNKLIAPKTGIPCVVAVYPLRVTGLSPKFPEKGQRRLKWFAPARAAELVAEPELAALLASFDARPAGTVPRP